MSASLDHKDRQSAPEMHYDLDGDFLNDVGEDMQGVHLPSNPETASNSDQSIDLKALSLDDYRSLRRGIPASDPASVYIDTSLEEKGSARDELDALLAAVEGDVIDNTVPMDVKDYLAVLEKAYIDAERKVQRLCIRSANLVESRNKVDKRPESKRTHALMVANKTLLENTADMAEAKSASQVALNRVKPLKATHKVLLPAPLLTAVPYGASLPFHTSLPIRRLETCTGPV
ncbi:hypothetical protein BGZ47_008923 [Haplosporangium gracile]|nr:hypothetical protein BGZ47_008923 [Haplosporangium gracile]